MKFLATLLLLPVLALAQDKNQISIVSYGHSGSGCPQGSVSSVISPDKTVLTFGFDKFQAYIGPGYGIQDRTRNCQLHLSLKYPSGFSFAVVDSTYHGFAYLEDGITANFYSTYFFSSDAANTQTTTTSIKGGGIWAEGQVYTKTTEVPGAGNVRSPCNGSQAILNVNNRINLLSNKASAVGMLTSDDATIALTQQVHIEWYKC